MSAQASAGSPISNEPEHRKLSSTGFGLLSSTRRAANATVKQIAGSSIVAIWFKSMNTGVRDEWRLPKQAAFEDIGGTFSHLTA
jgi:hypothetical protein